MTHLYAWLDRRFFPLVAGYVGHPLHIVGLVSLLPVLVNPFAPAILELIGGNYTNVLSAAAGAIVTRQTLGTHRTVEQHTERQEAHMAAIHAKLDALLGAPEAAHA